MTVLRTRGLEGEAQLPFAGPGGAVRAGARARATGCRPPRLRRSRARWSSSRRRLRPGWRSAPRCWACSRSRPRSGRCCAWPTRCSGSTSRHSRRCASPRAGSGPTASPCCWLTDRTRLTRRPGSRSSSPGRRRPSARSTKAHRTPLAHGEYLRAAGAIPRGATGDAAELTAHELRVAQLVAQGLTNRETAGALFVTAKTVEHHLRNVFRKLGVKRRTELARLMAAR